MPLLLIERLNAHASARPNAPAVSPVTPRGGAALAYGELRARAAGLARRLARELPPGAVVLLCCPNQPEYHVAFLAALWAGCTLFPVSAEIAEPELLSAAERAGASAVVGTARAVGLLRERVKLSIALSELNEPARSPAAPPRDADTAALLLLSSGTTGRPKLVRRSGQSLDAMAETLGRCVGFGPEDRVLITIPLCHSYGLEHGVLGPIAGGSCVRLGRGFDPQMIVDELAAGVTILPSVPSVYEGLTRLGGDAPPFAALRVAYSAGSNLPRCVFDAFLRRYGVRVGQLYGATEIGSVTFNNPAASDFEPVGVGLPMGGVSVRILDPAGPLSRPPLPPGEEGQVAVKAASMLSGYVGDDPPPLTEDGYFLIGDLGRLDARGALTVTGRIKLLIDVGGLKVNPIEVEDVLSEHPLVGSSVVVALPVTETIFRLKAVVTPKDPAAAPTPEDLRRFVRDRLSAYKVPRVFEVRASLPKSPTGKILRHLVEAS